MRHTIKSASIVSLFVFTNLISTSCSNSGFSENASKGSPTTAADGGAAATKGRAEAGSPTKNLQDASSAAGSSSASQKSLGIDGNAFEGAFETPTSNDATTLGCTLPIAVQKSMGAFVDEKPTAIALTGWGGGPVSQSQLGLKNLDLNTCQWFQAASKESVPRYMILYTKDGQSYAQPFKLAANAITYAACITSATSASLATGGAVSCLFMPKG